MERARVARLAARAIHLAASAVRGYWQSVRRRLGLRSQAGQALARGNDLRDHADVEVVRVGVRHARSGPAVEVLREPLASNLSTKDGSCVSEHVLLRVEDAGLDAKLAVGGGECGPCLVHAHKHLRLVEGALALPIDLDRPARRLDARVFEALLHHRRIVRGTSTTRGACAEHERRRDERHTHHTPHGRDSKRMPHR